MTFAYRGLSPLRPSRVECSRPRTKRSGSAHMSTNHAVSVRTFVSNGEQSAGQRALTHVPMLRIASLQVVFTIFGADQQLAVRVDTYRSAEVCR